MVDDLSCRWPLPTHQEPRDTLCQNTSAPNEVGSVASGGGTSSQLPGFPVSDFPATGAVSEFVPHPFKIIHVHLRFELKFKCVSFLGFTFVLAGDVAVGQLPADAGMNL